MTHRKCGRYRNGHPLYVWLTAALLSYRASGASYALTSYLSASPTINERISNGMPDKNREKRLAEKTASLDVKIKGKGYGTR